MSSKKFDPEMIGAAVCHNYGTTDGCKFGNECSFKHGDETRDDAKKRYKSAKEAKKASIVAEAAATSGFQTPQKKKVSAEILIGAPIKAPQPVIEKVCMLEMAWAEIKKLQQQILFKDQQIFVLEQTLNGFGAEMASSDMTAIAVAAVAAEEEHALEQADEMFAQE